MHTLTTADGLTLHLQSGPAAAAPVRGTVLIVHGLGEHIGRYAHVMAHLAAQGWATLGYDHRGHGRSGGPRGGLATDLSLLSDLGAVIAHARPSHPGPLLLLGHSMGGLVVSSPALDPGMHALQKLLLAVAAPLAPDRALGNGLKPEWVSSDPAVVRAYLADPLVHDRITPRLLRFIVEGGERVRQCAPQWRLPTLLLYAGADRCVAPRGSDAFAAAAPPARGVAPRPRGQAPQV